MDDDHSAQARVQLASVLPSVLGSFARPTLAPVPGEAVPMRRAVRVLVGLIAALTLFALPAVAAGHLGGPRGLGAVAQEAAPLPDLRQDFRLLANVPQPAHAPFGGTDLAFWGTRAYAGSFGGFRILDIEQPANPEVLADVPCVGAQGDVSVWGNELVFVSVDDPLTSPRCGGRPTDFATTPDAWEGIRVLGVSNPREPEYLTAVATDCGSHTHTLVPDLENDRVLLYVSSFNLFVDGPNCRAPSLEEPISHSQISIVEVPLDDPHAAAVINEPGEMFEGGQPCTPTASNPRVPSDAFFACNETDDESFIDATRGCHDIQVLLEARLAACSALSEAQIWDISDLEQPRVVKRLDNPAFEAWHNAVFTWDGTYVVFTDEGGIGTEAWCKPGDPDTIGANWIYRVEGDSTEPISHYKSPRTVVSARPEAEWCTAHNGAIVPVRGRYLHVQAYYSGGTSVTDFTDLEHPEEIAYFKEDDATPFEAPLTFSNTWSSYLYRGFVYANDIIRGVDVLFWRDPARRQARRLGHDNPQTQEDVLFGEQTGPGGGGGGPHRAARR